MLRVGLTGELGSGKSTVLRRFGELGAVTMSSDEMGRAMMRPGEPVFAAIVAQFGPEIVLPSGELDRPALARMAFDLERPRVEELNAIVHPAVLAAQEQRIVEIQRERPEAIVVVESALVFSTKYAGEQPWRRRFDRVVLVTAPDALKMQRFVERVSAGKPLEAAERRRLEADARARLEAQRIPAKAKVGCLEIENDGSAAQLESKTERMFAFLLGEQRAMRS